MEVNRFAVPAIDDVELLLGFRSDGEHDSPPFGQLIEQRFREFRGCRCDENAVKRRRFWPSGRTVSDSKSQISEPQSLFKQLASRSGKGCMPFNREHFTSELGEHSSLVTAAGPDFEHLLGTRQRKFLGHQGDHEGLTDGLITGDRQRSILPGIRLHRDGNESIAGDPQECFEDV
jgi:hypothetical protein